MKLAVFGKSGQLSQALNRVTLGSPCEAVFYSRQDCNLAADAEEIRKFVTQMPKADVVVIAAAYTGVEQAEQDVDTAFAVNAKAPEIIAKICKQRGIPLIYISTDYVFDGAEISPYEPDHSPSPLNVYGRSKRAGEIAVVESGAEYVILRTSWLFDGLGRNFMTTMLKLQKDGKRIKVIGDQIGRPTYVGHLAESVIRAAVRLCDTGHNCSGLYHVTNTGEPVSWAGFARAIFKEYGSNINTSVIVDEVLTKEYENKVARPAYSVLDTSSFEKTFCVTLSDWHEGLDLALAEWRQKTG